MTLQIPIFDPSKSFILNTNPIDLIKIFFLVPTPSAAFFMILGFIAIPFILGFITMILGIDGVKNYWLPTLPIIFVLMIYVILFNPSVKGYKSYKESVGGTVEEYIELQRKINELKKK